MIAPSEDQKNYDLLFIDLGVFLIVLEYGKFSIPFPFWLGVQMQLLPIKAHTL
jgi:hypothetical protein